MTPVRRLFGWMAGLVGIAALARLLASRRARLQAPAHAPALPAPDPAEELRRKLAETREQPATASEDAGPPTETIDERRARVHAKAQEALDAMEALQEPPG